MPQRTPPPPVPDEDVVMVQFKGHRKGCYHNRKSVELQVGDYCLVEADRGKDMGRVCYIGPGKSGWWKEARQQGVLGRASTEDLSHLHENRADEWDYFDTCLEKIQQRKLKMQLVSVEKQFDRNKITFYFTAEKRVDFRMLVKDLAGIFRTRIELRQIGVRDEAKMKGGLGICGRSLCCSTFLHEFTPVTLKMAKTQQLPLSPNKLSGLCGRLRCCLGYEFSDYKASLKRMPRIGTRVQTPEGPGVVNKIDLLENVVAVYCESLSEVVVMPVGELKWERGGDLPPGRRRRGRQNHKPNEGGR